MRKIFFAIPAALCCIGNIYAANVGIAKQALVGEGIVELDRKSVV